MKAKRKECLSSSGIKYELMEWSLDMAVATKKNINKIYVTGT